MSCSRRQIASYISDGIASLDCRACLPQDSGARVFYKRSEGLILTLGLEFSDLYATRFTGSFYLSPSFKWGYMLPGFPHDAFRRIGRFLTAEERQHLLGSEYTRPGVVDAWWTEFSEASASAFLKAVELTEPRFLSQPGLRESIAKSEKMKQHMAMLDETSILARELREPPTNLQYQPTKYLKPVSPEWYWAAEVVLQKHASPKLMHRRYVELVAVDAWRVKNLP